MIKRLTFFLRRLKEQVEHHRFISLLFGVAIIIIVISQILIFNSFGFRSDGLVIRFTRHGIDQFGGAGEIQSYALIALVIVIVNLIVAFELENKDWFWGRALAVLTLVFAILIFIAFWVIVSVN